MTAGALLLVLALAAPEGLVFEEQVAALPFQQRNGRPDKPLLLECMGAGLACADLDRDGDVDLFLAGGGALEEKAPTPDAIFWNDGKGKFTRGESLPGEDTWSMGVTLADYDEDGDLDAYITSFGHNKLLRNDGKGRFTDVTAAAGVDDPRWSMGSSWADYDGDGDLDLFVANYVDREAALDPHSVNEEMVRWRGLEVALGPAGLKGAGDALFQNQGDGTFKRVEKEAGVDDPRLGYGFQTLFTDLTGDHLPDLFVANDSTPNFFYRNKGDGTFKEEGIRAGVAFTLDGLGQAAMGACLGDPDRDGDLDLVTTNFSSDYNTFYRNVGGGFFEDATAEVGLRTPTWTFLSWACIFADLDADGRDELFIANGHIYPQVDDADFNTSYRQRDHLFRYKDGKFVELDAGLKHPDTSRGACLADLDGDGRQDIVVNVLDGKPTILWNRSKTSAPVVRVRLEAARPPRTAVGAVIRAAGRTEVVLAGEAFLGSAPYEKLIPLGGMKEGDPVKVEVAWPSGRKETFTVKAGDRVVLKEGTAGK